MSWSVEEKLDYVLGQIHALSAFAQATLKTHPDPNDLLRVFEEQILKTEANTLFLPVTEAHSAGMRVVRSMLYEQGANPAES